MEVIKSSSIASAGLFPLISHLGFCLILVSGLNDVCHLARHPESCNFRMLPILRAMLLSTAVLLNKTLSFGSARTVVKSEVSPFECKWQQHLDLDPSGPEV